MKQKPVTYIIILLKMLIMLNLQLRTRQGSQINLRLDIFDTEIKIERRLILLHSMKRVKNDSEYISKALLSYITEGNNLKIIFNFI